jgi:hypothetical protein
MNEKPRSDEKLKDFLGVLQTHREQRSDDEDVIQVKKFPYTLRSQDGLWVNSRIRWELNRRTGPPDVPD